MSTNSKSNLTCGCRTCVGHRHEVKDYHPEIPWKTSIAIKRDILKQLTKTWGKETARKMFEMGQF